MGRNGRCERTADIVNSILCKSTGSRSQDTILFDMDVLNNPSLKRDETFYRRGCNLVETLKEQLETQQASDEFIHHLLYIQCSLLDQIVLSSAPQQENPVCLAAPL
ncbi:hypothetical protein [Pantoea allii]|uniref:hypothetical protein n=1 Tax=Pantoea allii TaxID=574096 RepID=UPI003D7AB60E